MNRLLALSTIKMGVPFEIKATPEELAAFKEHFEFDDIKFITGHFIIQKDTSITPCYLLTGEIKALASVENKEWDISLPLKLYLIENEDKIEDFPLDDDVELIEDGAIDIGDVISQYIFLYTLDLDAEDEDACVSEIEA